MISPKEKEVLKKAIGRGYAKKVKSWVDKKNITDQKNKSYSENFITGVMNGYNHEILETEILLCANYYDSLNDQENAKKEEIFKKLKKNNERASSTENSAA